MDKLSKVYDLEERTARFGEKIISLCKSLQETKHWIRMLASYFVDRKPELVIHWKECQELTLIFQKIGNSLNKN